MLAIFPLCLWPAGSDAAENDPFVIVVDDEDPMGFRTEGWWGESDAGGEYGGYSKYTDAVGASATWTPNFPAGGRYDVYAWWDYFSTRDTNALYTVHYADGSTADIRESQQESHGQFTYLGTYEFDAGTSGHVVLTRDDDSTGTSTSADAVMFAPARTQGHLG